jgi:hypothetical protein
MLPKGETYRLVHHTKGNLSVALVLGSNLRPKASKLDVGRTALTNNGAVPATVVVHIDDAHLSTSIQAALDLFVVGGPVVCVEGATNGVHKVLPANGKAEGVEAIVGDEVLHLVETGLARVDNVAAARAVGSTAKVETGDLSQHVSILSYQNSEAEFSHTLTPAYWTPPEEAWLTVVAAGFAAEDF